MLHAEHFSACNIEKLGVAWGRGYFIELYINCRYLLIFIFYHVSWFYLNITPVISLTRPSWFSVCNIRNRVWEWVTQAPWCYYFPHSLRKNLPALENIFLFLLHEHKQVWSPILILKPYTLKPLVNHLPYMCTNTGRVSGLLLTFMNIHIHWGEPKWAPH